MASREGTDRRRALRGRSKDKRGVHVINRQGFEKFEFFREYAGARTNPLSRARKKKGVRNYRS